MFVKCILLCLVYIYVCVLEISLRLRGSVGIHYFIPNSTAHNTHSIAEICNVQGYEGMFIYSLCTRVL